MGDETTYDPIGDLSFLLAAAQRLDGGWEGGGVRKFAARLEKGLGLPDLATPQEAEDAIRATLAGLDK